ncbi:MAG: RNA polymerase subunit sigma [Planctomycetaceae bacterium]|nr:RNA polymerase subunit sigma [Planctomycetaceae bacterium]
MSGPIVRTGTTPKFWKNWDNVFGDKSGNGGAEKKEVNAFAKPKKKTAKKAAPKAAAPKSSGKKKGKKK